MSLLLGGLLLFSSGCVHRVHVTPAPPAVSSASHTQSIQVLVPFLAIEGADHMPGIPLFEWPAQDLRNAAIDYIRSRHSFSSVGEEPADQTLIIKAWLTLRSRGRYHYRLRLEAAIGPQEKPPLASYMIEKEAIGSRVRWFTSSDQAPIAEAVQAAMDELLTRIETDPRVSQVTPR